jgi:hypothetical protein
VRRVLTVGCLVLLSINALMLLAIPDALGYIAEAIGHARGWPPGWANDGALRTCAAFGSLFALSGTIAAAFIRKSSRLLAATAGIMQVYLYFFYVSAAV